jgi:hypothetical protein
VKKLISICFLLLFVVIESAQENKKSKWSKLNQDQLNLALKHSSINIKTGKILTFVGVGAMFIDVARVFAEGFGKKTSAQRRPDVGSSIGLKIRFKVDI